MKNRCKDITVRNNWKAGIGERGVFSGKRACLGTVNKHLTSLILDAVGYQYRDVQGALSESSLTMPWLSAMLRS